MVFIATIQLQEASQICWNLQGMHRSETYWASRLSSMTPWRVKKTNQTTSIQWTNIYIQKYTLYVYTISLHYTILLIHLHLHIRIRVYELYVYTYMYCIETPSITHLAPALSSRAMAVLAFARRLAVGSTNCRRKPRLPGSRTTTWWISIGILCGNMMKYGFMGLYGDLTTRDLMGLILFTRLHHEKTDWRWVKLQNFWVNICCHQNTGWYDGNWVTFRTNDMRYGSIFLENKKNGDII